MKPTLKQRLEKLIEDKATSPVMRVNPVMLIEDLQPFIKEIEQYEAGNKRPSPCENLCEQVSFKRTIAGLEKELEASRLNEAKVKAESIREAIAEYIASHEAPDGCYQMAWFHGYADGIHQEGEDNANKTQQ